MHVYFKHALAQFRDVIFRANDTPVHKYTEPQTSSQEIGWMTQPLVFREERTLCKKIISIFVIET